MNYHAPRLMHRFMRIFGFVPTPRSLLGMLPLARTTFLALVTALLLFPTPGKAQLNFPDSLINVRDGKPLGNDARKVIVLIHGWTATTRANAPANVYSASAEWEYLMNALKLQLQGTDWKLVLYHWEKDASTGLIDFALNPFNSEGPYLNAVLAAANAKGHSTHLALSLNSQAPDLRQVHFIAHSAGSWMAQGAVLSLLEANRYAVGQVTLLDPFIPEAHDNLLGLAYVGSTGFSTAAMNSLAASPHRNRIYRLENYYADDNPLTPILGWNFLSGTTTYSTQETFSWDLNTDINLQVEHGALPLVNYHQYYDYHSGPIEFYADTVSAASGTVYPGLVSNNPGFTYTSVGYYRSIAYQGAALLPRITTQPQNRTAPVGGTATLSVTADGATAYEWYKGNVYKGSGATLTLNNLTSSDAGDYVVRVSNSNGLLYSDKARLTVGALPQLSISAITPRILSTQATGQTQQITITGRNFTTESLLTFSNGTTNYPNRVPTFVNSGELRYNIAVGPDSATWTAIVTNGNVESLPYTFYAISGSVQLTGLSITGPATVAENNSAQFSASAYFSDGSTQPVAPIWSEDSNVTTISASGVLSASNVNADRQVTVAAVYTSGGITKLASTTVTIVNGGSAGASQVTNVIVNGTFENGDAPWGTPNGSADVVNLSYPHNGAWYAYVGNANNATGGFAQFFPIPAAATAATLSFYIDIVTAETTTTTKFDKLKVDLVTGGDQYVGTIAEFSNLDKGDNVNGTYVWKSYNIQSLISGHRGQSLFLVFSGTTDNGLSTIFRIDDVKLEITTPGLIELTGLSISGASAIAEGGFQAYNAIAIFSDGTTQTVSPNSWSENSNVTSIDSNGFLIASQVNGDTDVTLTAAYTFNGVERQTTKVVTVIEADAPVTFTALAIDGPGSIEENTTNQYVGTAVFSDGSTQSVQPSWSENSTFASVSNSGVLSAGEIAVDTAITLAAAYTIGGVTRTATRGVVIQNRLVPATFVGLVIDGPTTVEEHTTALLTATAAFSDGSILSVVPYWGENSPDATVSGVGLLSAGEVDTDTVVTVEASATIDGVTHSDSKQITIRAVPDTSGPVISVETPANGATVGNALLRVSGIATDEGAGASGIASVTVNGVAARGGTANGAATASWSADITLATGPNSISVVATDGAGNSTQKQWSVNYTQLAYTLNITANNGTVAKDPELDNYAAGTQVTLTAIANADYVFGGWAGAATGITNPLRVTMDSNKTISANFISGGGPPVVEIVGTQLSVSPKLAFGMTLRGPKNSSITVQESLDLKSWRDIGRMLLTSNSNQEFEVHTPPTEGGFFRLKPIGAPVIYTTRVKLEELEPFRRYQLSANANTGGAMLDFAIGPDNALIPVGLSLGIGHVWFNVEAGELINASFVSGTAPLVSSFAPAEWTSIVLTGEPFLMAFWLDDNENGTPGYGDSFGWARLEWEPAGLVVSGSATEASGKGIVAGAPQVAP